MSENFSGIWSKFFFFFNLVSARGRNSSNPFLRDEESWLWRIGVYKRDFNNKTGKNAEEKEEIVGGRE